MISLAKDTQREPDLYNSSTHCTDTLKISTCLAKYETRCLYDMLAFSTLY